MEYRVVGTSSIRRRQRRTLNQLVPLRSAPIGPTRRCRRRNRAVTVQLAADTIATSDTQLSELRSVGRGQAVARWTRRTADPICIRPRKSIQTESNRNSESQSRKQQRDRNAPSHRHSTWIAHGRAWRELAPSRVTCLSYRRLPEANSRRLTSRDTALPSRFMLN